MFLDTKADCVPTAFPLDFRVFQAGQDIPGCILHPEIYLWRAEPALHLSTLQMKVAD
jgi:hypothetical protein